VPTELPGSVRDRRDVVVIVSGLVEIALGLALLALPPDRVVVGLILAGPLAANGVDQRDGTTTILARA
jgi:hypothetical protein